MANSYRTSRRQPGLGAADPSDVLPQDQERRTVEFSDADGERLGATTHTTCDSATSTAGFY